MDKGRRRGRGLGKNLPHTVNSSHLSKAKAQAETDAQPGTSTTATETSNRKNRTTGGEDPYSESQVNAFGSTGSSEEEVSVQLMNRLVSLQISDSVYY